MSSQSVSHEEEIDVAKESSRAHVVTVHGRAIYMEEDWTSGIGGGLWSTGLALAKYLDSDHARAQLEKMNIESALELGSGNGFLAVCLLAASVTSPLKQLVVTDTKEHLKLMQHTVTSNLEASFSPNEAKAVTIDILEYLWGTGPLILARNEAATPTTFDLIIGSDLAYRDALHDPLIDAFLKCSHQRTTILLGVTMNDTKPIFFTKLNSAGFQYEKLADHCVDPSFRGNHFGIFVIRRR